MKNDAPFEYIFIETSARELFEQYVELRRRGYLGEYAWLPSDFGYADETDRVSHIVLAMSQGVVAGGARLTISTPEYPRSLPLEDVGFSLRDCAHLKHLNLALNPYGEISRMAANPECAHGFELSWGLGNALCARAARQGVDALFSICPDFPARINQRNAKRRGVRFEKYQQVPTVFGVNMWLCAFSGLRGIYGSGKKEAA